MLSVIALTVIILSAVLPNVVAPQQINCLKLIGRPSPTLTWWIDGFLVDSTSYKEGTDTVVNKLTNMKAERCDFFSFVLTPLREDADTAKINLHLRQDS
jgi:hypothetical protein